MALVEYGHNCRTLNNSNYNKNNQNENRSNGSLVVEERNGDSSEVTDLNLLLKDLHVEDRDVESGRNDFRAHSPHE